MHPKKPDVVWVAAQGPLWSKGGDRGLFKTTDGGKTWTKVLGAGEWTGVTDVALDPRNPDVLYAATWQRHRTVAALHGRRAGVGAPPLDRRRRDVGEAEEGPARGPARQDRPRDLAAEPGRRLRRHRAEPPHGRPSTARPTAARRGRSARRPSPGRPGPTTTRSSTRARTPRAASTSWTCGCRSRTTAARPSGAMEEKDKHSDNHAIAFRAGRPRLPARRHRRRDLRELRPREDLALRREPAGHAVLQDRGRRRRALLHRLRRHAGQQHPGRPRRAPTASNGITNARLVHHPLRRRPPAGHRARQPRHPVLRVAAGEPRARRPHDRRARLHPAAARAGRPRRALQLGRADPREPALAEAALLRLAARVALRRPRRQLARGLGRPHARTRTA